MEHHTRTSAHVSTRVLAHEYKNEYFGTYEYE